MKLTREAIEKMRLRQLKHLQQQIDARETRAKSIMLRKQWMERQNNANYRNEYDRIMGELSRFRGPTTDKEKLQNRAETLHRRYSSGNA